MGATVRVGKLELSVLDDLVLEGDPVLVSRGKALLQPFLESYGPQQGYRYLAFAAHLAAKLGGAVVSVVLPEGESGVVF